MFEPTPLEMIVDARIPLGLGGHWYGVFPALVAGSLAAGGPSAPRGRQEARDEEAGAVQPVPIPVLGLDDLRGELVHVAGACGPNHQSKKELDGIEKEAEELVLSSKILVCGIHNAAHQRAAVVPLRWAVRNHIGTLHAIAAVNGLEAAMGLLAEATCPPGKRWIPVGMTVRYTAKATTDLLCVAETDDEDWESDEVAVRVKAVRRDGVAAVAGVITIRISARPDR